MDLGNVFRNPREYLKIPDKVLGSAQKLLGFRRFPPLGLGNMNTVITNPNLEPKENVQPVQPSIRDTVGYQPPSLVNAINNMRQQQEKLVNYQQGWPGRTANMAQQYTNLVRPERFWV